MNFNSMAFALFLVLVFALYHFLGRQGTEKGMRRQNVLLLVSSYFFYGCWDWRFLFLIFISTVVDYYAALGMERQPHRKKRWMALSLILNLGMLGFFKYAGFFVGSLERLLHAGGMTADWPTLNILVPAGISFYTFQTLSYTIDVYRGQMKPTRDALSFFTYVAFFPQLVAGPIERAVHLLPQFLRQRQFTYPEAVRGLRLILWGIFKKVVIADRFGEYSDDYFSHALQLREWDAVLAGIVFAFQVYADFSAYSDIAQGSAKLFGFDLMQNFRTPFLGRSIREFWSRWHISLTGWFRDYIYFPLGGSRRGPFRYRLNLLLIFLISGFWHGAMWHYVIWGLICGMAMVLETFVPVPRQPSLFRQVGGMLIAFFTFSLSMIFFRAECTQCALAICKGMFMSYEAGMDWHFDGELSLSSLAAYQVIYLIFCGAFVMLADAFIGEKTVDLAFDRLPRALRWGVYYFLILWLVTLGAWDVPVQFVYFQF